jgi:hypothetical protein
MSDVLLDPCACPDVPNSKMPLALTNYLADYALE